MSTTDAPAPERPEGPAAATGGRARLRALELSTRQNLLVAVVVLGIAAIAPLFLDEGGDIMNNMVLAAAYAVMALGLNIIVGFAGLLDLGYVAFFAIGAYTVGYFGSGFWSNAGGGEGVHFFVGEPSSILSCIHLNFLLILVLAVIVT